MSTDYTIPPDGQLSTVQGSHGDVPSPTTISIVRARGTYSTFAEPTEDSNLVIVPGTTLAYWDDGQVTWQHDGTWQVVHVPSSQPVAAQLRLVEARGVAHKVAQLADWSQAADVLSADVDLRSRVHEQVLAVRQLPAQGAEAKLALAEVFGVRRQR